MRNNLSKLNRELLLETLRSQTNPIELCNIICEITKRGIHSSSTREAIAFHKDNQDVFWNTFLVSDFARAALHILKWEKYNGDRREVLKLIESGLQI